MHTPTGKPRVSFQQINTHQKTMTHKQRLAYRRQRDLDREERASKNKEESPKSTPLSDVANTEDTSSGEEKEVAPEHETLIKVVPETPPSYLKAFIGPFSFEAFIDTGAELSCMNLASYERLVEEGEKLKGDQKFHFDQAVTTKVKVRLAVGSPKRTEGVTYLPIRVGDQLLIRPVVLVKDLHYDFILGKDYVVHAGITLDLARCRATTGDGENIRVLHRVSKIPGFVGRGAKFSVALPKRSTTVLPPRTSKRVTFKVQSNSRRFDGKTGDFEPLPYFRSKGLIVGKGIYTCGDGNLLSLVVHNGSSDPITLKRSEPVGVWQRATYDVPGDSELKPEDLVVNLLDPTHKERNHQQEESSDEEVPHTTGGSDTEVEDEDELTLKGMPSALGRDEATPPNDYLRVDVGSYFGQAQASKWRELIERKKEIFHHDPKTPKRTTWFNTGSTPVTARQSNNDRTGCLGRRTKSLPHRSRTCTIEGSSNVPPHLGRLPSYWPLSPTAPGGSA